MVLELFENALDEQDVTLTSPEDSQKEPGNDAKLYGSVYSDLLDEVEERIIETLKEAGVPEEKYVSYEFSGR